MTKASTPQNKANIASSPCCQNGSRKSCAERVVSNFHVALSFPTKLSPAQVLAEHTCLDITTHRGCLLLQLGATFLEKRPRAGDEKGVGKFVVLFF